MHVYAGNVAPHECTEVGGAHAHLPLVHGQPCLYSHPIPEGDGGFTFTPGHDGREIALHLARHPDVTHLPGDEAVIKVLRDWAHHSTEPPGWVFVPDNEDAERQLAEAFGCARGLPADLEATHWTTGGAPPGVDSGIMAEHLERAAKPAVSSTRTSRRGAR